MRPIPGFSKSDRGKSGGVEGAATLVALIGILITVFAVSLAITSARHSAQTRLEEAGTAAVHGFEEAVERAEARLVAVSGLVHASEFVTAVEFRDFVTDLGIVPGMEGIGYVMTVPVDDLQGFVDVAATQHGQLAPFGLDTDFRALPLDGSRGTYEIILYAEPTGLFSEMVGLDLGSLPDTHASLASAMASGETTATAPFLPSPQFDGGEFLALRPTIAADGSGIGFAAALMDPAEIISAGMAEYVRAGDTVTLTDVTGRILEPPDPGTWLTVHTMLGRQWQVELVPDTRFVAFSPTRIAALVLGILTSIGAGVLTFALIQTRRARAEVARMAATTEQTDRLLAIVSHELRTPLSAVIGFLDELRVNWDLYEDRERAELVALAGMGAQEIASLVADLLVRERILSGAKLAVAKLPTSVGDEVDRVLAENPLFGDVNVEPGSLLSVASDPIRLRQILRNLVANAFKHGSPPVTISMTEVDRVGRILVSDEGPGVKECCLPTIFELGGLWCQEDHERPIDSNGFGLPVSRFIARSMGGDLSYDPASQAFEVTIPLATDDDLPASRVA